jgi:hypothetical protein
MRTAFRIAVLGLVCALAVPAQTRAGDTVLVWNEIAVNTAIANGQNPFVQARTNAVVSLGGLRSGEHHHRRLRAVSRNFQRTERASVDAAAAAAAWRVLRTYFRRQCGDGGGARRRPREHTQRHSQRPGERRRQAARHRRGIGDDCAARQRRFGAGRNSRHPVPR